MAVHGDDLKAEVTPPSAYFNRRSFLLAATAIGTGIAYRALSGRSTETVETPKLSGLVAAAPGGGFRTDETPTSFSDVTHYNNFYEFSTDKDGVAGKAAGFTTAGWTLSIGGLVRRPRVLSLAEVLAVAAPEERIYRMRCVEAWSMVIPWAGYSLSKLLEEVEPLPSAKYVAFQTLHDPKRMPGQETDVLEWPYVEGLRLDEAMHPLTLLASGLYGRELPPQDGAPLRVVVPWKYGFKGIKSIVRMTLVADRPPTTWNRAAPKEYGFYANVNPAVPHPRWSQATEQRIGEPGRRQTLPFNGYAEQVAGLYAGMDLRADY